MLPIFRKSGFSIAFVVMVIATSAQTDTQILSGSFTESVIADMWVNKVIGNKLLRIAEFKISPDNRNFLLAIPGDTGVVYRIQINLYKPGGRHPKLNKIVVLPLTLHPGQSYSLNITPSKLDTVKKLGWTMAKSLGVPAFALISGRVSDLYKAIPITLHGVSDGDLVSSSSFNTNNSGAFVLPVAVKKPGFYYLSSPRWRVRIYLDPLEKLELSIDNKTGLITGIKGSQVNLNLFHWQQLISPITRYGYNLSAIQIDTINLDAYIDGYIKLQPQMEKFIHGFNVPDIAASKAMAIAMKTDRELAPLKILPSSIPAF